MKIRAIREIAVPINSTLRNAVFDFSEMTLAIVAGFGVGGCEAYPGVFGIFAGFADDAQVEDGFIRLADRPGIGFEGQNELYAVMRTLV